MTMQRILSQITLISKTWEWRKKTLIMRRNLGKGRQEIGRIKYQIRR
jgi:hypothetical protein